MGSARDWSTEIDTLVAHVRTYYVFPDVAERVCQLLRRRLGDGAYRNLADEKALADVVTADLQSVNGDQHLFLQHTAQELPEQAAPTVDSGRLRAEQAALTGHGFARVERLPGNVGLLEIRNLYEPTLAGAGTAAAAAMNLVASGDVLLIDLRGNTGGEPEMVALLCSFLFDKRTQLSTLYFPAEDASLQYWTAPFVPGPTFGGSKPIYVLTSERTFSGGEGMSYDLQQCRRATLVGETTAGAANFHYPYRVSAHLLSAVPSGYPVNPVSGTCWEGVGVRPHVPTSAERAFPTAYRLALHHVLGLGAEGARRAVTQQARQALTELEQA